MLWEERSEDRQNTHQLALLGRRSTVCPGLLSRVHRLLKPKSHIRTLMMDLGGHWAPLLVALPSVAVGNEHLCFFSYHLFSRPTEDSVFGSAGSRLWP